MCAGDLAWSSPIDVGTIEAAMVPFAPNVLLAVDDEGNRAAVVGSKSGTDDAVKGAAAQILLYSAATGQWSAIAPPSSTMQDKIVVTGAVVSAHRQVIDNCGMNNCPTTLHFRRLDLATGAWSAEVTAPTCEFPTLLDLPAGDALLLCYQDYGTSITTLSLSRYVAATDTWDAPTTLVPSGSGDFQVNYPRAAVSSSGEIALLYMKFVETTFPDGKRTLYATHYDPALSAWGPPNQLAEKIDTGPGSFWIRDERMAIVWDASGDATAIWGVAKSISDFEGVPHSLEAARYDGGTKSWSMPEVIASGRPVASGAFVGFADRVSVFWYAPSGAGQPLLPASFNTFDPLAGSWAGEQDVTPSVATSAIGSQSALDAGDNAFVAWTVPMSGDLLVGHRFGAGPWSAATSFAGLIWSYDIAALGECKALLVWIDDSAVRASSFE